MYNILLFAEPFQFFCPFCFRFFTLSYSRYFLLFISFLLAKKVLTLSLENPEKGTLTNYRCTGLFKQRFCTKNGFCFSFSSVRMQPILKNEQSCRKVDPSSIRFLSRNSTDVLIDDVTSESMTAPPNSA